MYYNYCCFNLRYCIILFKSSKLHNNSLPSKVQDVAGANLEGPQVTQPLTSCQNCPGNSTSASSPYGLDGTLVGNTPHREGHTEGK